MTRTCPLSVQVLREAQPRVYLVGAAPDMTRAQVIRAMLDKHASVQATPSPRRPVWAWLRSVWVGAR